MPIPVQLHCNVPRCLGCLICTPQHNVLGIRLNVAQSILLMEIPVNCFIGCSAMELWNLPAVGATFFSDATLLDDATQYPSCDDRSVGSVALVNTTLNTATVIYYTGTTPGSRACFVCDEGNGYEPTNNERICQSNSTWSGSPTMCGMLYHFASLCCA